MYPILFKFYGLEIHTYGFFIAIGFMLSLFLAQKLAIKEGFSKNTIVDYAFFMLIFAIIGARIFYVIIEYKYYIKYPFDIFKIWEGGLVYYGGFIFAVLSIFIYHYKRFKNTSFLKITDIFATVLPLAQAIGRIGCLSAGCCYGKPCKLPWAIKFTNPDSLAPLNRYLHPTEIYHSISNLTIFLILMFMFNKKRKFNGQITCLYGIFYSIGRFIIEFFRGDPRGYVWIFSTSQFISIIVFSISLIAYVYLSKKNSIDNSR